MRSSRSRLYTALTILAALSSVAGATVKPTFNNQTAFNKHVDIVSLSGNSHSLPTEIATVSSQLPTGSFLIKNKLDKPIMAVSVVWEYTDQDGKKVDRPYLCDGYLRVPSAAIVESHSSALITPQGCTAESLFPRLVTGGLMGAPFETQNKFTPSAKSATGLSVTIDSIIYRDGEIVGPDTKNYSQEIVLRDQAMRSVASTIASSNESTTSLTERLSTLSANAQGSRDKLTQLQGRWAATLRRSPNPTATLDLIQKEQPLPTFFHSKQGGL